MDEILWRLTDIVAMKADDSYWFQLVYKAILVYQQKINLSNENENEIIAVSYYGRERKRGVGDAAPGNSLGSRFVHERETPFLNKEGTTKRILLFSC